MLWQNACLWLEQCSEQVERDSTAVYVKSDNEKQKNMENWVDFVKLKHAHSEPTRNSEVRAGHFTNKNDTNQFAHLADNSCNRLKRRLKFRVVHKGLQGFSA